MEDKKEIIGDDWFDALSEEQQDSVLLGLAQADRGECISHEEAVILLDL